MSDEPVVKSQPSAEGASAMLARVPRREALKGLGALAVSTTALAATGCGTEMMSEDGTAPASAEASNAGAMTSMTSTSTSTTSSMSAGGAPGTAPSMAAPSKSTMTSGAMGTATTPTAASSAGGAGAGSGAMAGSPAMPATASPSAAGAMAPATAAGSGGTDAMMTMMDATTDLSSLDCILSPAMTEGPFFVEEKLNRSDLVMGESDEAIVKAVPLTLIMGIYKADGTMCMPLPGLQVDIWHANAIGVYSDVRSGFVQSTDTQGKQFLRGYQITNEVGVVQFATIYPGWYPSRTIHIHFKIRMPMGGNAAYDFTSQMFFDEAITKEVLTMAPYSGTPGTRSVFNDDDHIYNGTAMNGQKPPAGQTAPGLETTVTLNKMGNGFVGLLKIGLQV